MRLFSTLIVRGQAVGEIADVDPVQARRALLGLYLGRHVFVRFGAGSEPVPEAVARQAQVLLPGPSRSPAAVALRGGRDEQQPTTDADLSGGHELQCRIKAVAQSPPERATVPPRCSTVVNNVLTYAEQFDRHPRIVDSNQRNRWRTTFLESGAARPPEGGGGAERKGR